MNSKTAGFPSQKLLNSLGGELVELSSENIALDLRIPLGGLKRQEPFPEDSQVLAPQLLHGLFR